MDVSDLSLTRAQAQSGVHTVVTRTSATESNLRHIPYSEWYSCLSSVTETPIERLQMAARDEERRKSTR